MAATRNVFAFSDTHVGARYANSNAPEQEELIKRGIESADIVVIAGDAFEFTQGEGTAAERLERAKATMLRWQSYHPEAEFHFLPGNHEAPRNLASQQKGAYRQQQLEAILPLWPQLRDFMQEHGIQTHEDYCRIGDAVLVHGHIDTCPPEEQLPSKLNMQTYHYAGNVIAPGTHLAKRYFPNSKVVPATHQAIRHSMQAQDSSPDAPVNHLLFGHTHHAMFEQQFDFDGCALGNHVQHYNLGCSVVGRCEQFQPVMFTLEGDRETGRTKYFELAKQALYPKGYWDALDERPFFTEICDTRAANGRTCGRA
jgi:UDP-2,3-diacylglucosamine pyrophosphatase LpxH